MTATISDEVAAKAMSAAASIPERVRGRHITAQNAVGNRYHGESTPLSAISIGASGSRIRAAPSMARSQGDRMYPSLA